MVESIFKVGVIGHRDLDDYDAYHYAQLCCHEIISGLRKKYSSIRAVSAIAKGADSLFAQVAASQGIQLDTVIPFGNFDSDFRDEESYSRYKVLRDSSKHESTVNFKERSGKAYQKSMEWVVFKSNLIVAFWDGREVGTKGGTWEAVVLCKKLNKKFIHVDVTRKVMNLYFNRGYELSKVCNIKSRDIMDYLEYAS